MALLWRLHLMSGLRMVTFFAACVVSSLLFGFLLGAACVLLDCRRVLSLCPKQKDGKLRPATLGHECQGNAAIKCNTCYSFSLKRKTLSVLR